MTENGHHNNESSQVTSDSHSSSAISTVLESKVFALAMKVAEKYAYSKSKIYRLLQHAFEKLKEESNRKLFQKDFKEKAQVLMRMMKAYYHGDYQKIPAAAVFRILGGLIYFVWILDLVPDFIPILGLADDLAVIIWVYNGLSEEIEDFEVWESATAIDIEDQ